MGSAAVPAYPEVAADGSAGFDAVWADRRVMTAHWSAQTRTWTRATALSGRVSLQTAPAELAASPSGAAAAVWTVGSPGEAQAIAARYRARANGAWQPRATLFSSRTQSVYSPQVGVDGHGIAYAVWRVVGGAIDLAEHPAGARSWSRRVTLVTDPKAGSDGFRGGPVLAVSPAGTLAIAWEHTLAEGPEAPSRGLLYVKVRPAGSASWLPTLNLGAEGEVAGAGEGPGGPYTLGPRIALNRRSTVFVVWQWPHRGAFYPRAAVLARAGGWRKPRLVSLRRPGINPVIAADGRGSATVLWESSNAQGVSTQIEQADLSPKLRVVRVGSLRGGGVPPVIAANGRGDLVATWGDPSAAALRPARRGWCRPVALGASTEAQVAIAPDGVAQVIWHRGSDRRPVTPILARTLTRCRA